jgi:hypothetical protein
MSDAALLARLRALEARLERIEKPDQGGVAGEYTPTYVGGTTAGVTTYSTQQGVYYRLGRLIVATGAVVWTGATGTGDARISLPFAGSAGLNQTGSIRLNGVTFVNSTPQVEFASTAYFVMRSPITNGGGNVVQVEAAGNVIFTLAYLIDA